MPTVSPHSTCKQYRRYSSARRQRSSSRCSSGSRALDFGHWIAHKMESLTEHRLRHGTAVALGMAVDLLYPTKVGSLPIEQCERILDLLVFLGFSLMKQELLAFRPGTTPVLFEELCEFREHLGGDFHITLLRDVGFAFEVTKIDEDGVLESICWLEERFSDVPDRLPQRLGLPNRREPP